MSLDFQQVRQQVSQMGENAPQVQARLRKLRQLARGFLEEAAADIAQVNDRLAAALRQNPSLRCALPAQEPIHQGFPCPPLPETANILAADGSQINPDRHAPVDYCLVNVGAILMSHGSPASPQTTIRSKLLYDDEMYTSSGRITEQLVALMRDLNERTLLADLAADLTAPIITLTDGPLELWLGRDSSPDSDIFQQRFNEYLEALRRLKNQHASTAGYVDKPRSDLVVRMLEVLQLAADELDQTGRKRNLRGVTDADLYTALLGPGERSAVFAIQSRTAKRYSDELALHFFYLNVGRADRPYLARVEVPAWVAHDLQMLADLHAILVNQCQILGSRPYPYLLHRSHEVAVVSMNEKAQVENMIALELRKRGLTVGLESNKQFAKDLSGQRNRFQGIK